MTRFSWHHPKHVRGGLYFHCSFPVQRGQLFSLRFSIPTLDVPIEVEVVARWTEKVDDATYGVGVQFLGLKAREVWALTKFSHLWRPLSDFFLFFFTMESQSTPSRTGSCLELSLYSWSSPMFLFPASVMEPVTESVSV